MSVIKSHLSLSVADASLCLLPLYYKQTDITSISKGLIVYNVYCKRVRESIPVSYTHLDVYKRQRDMRQQSSLFQTAPVNVLCHRQT